MAVIACQSTFFTRSDRQLSVGNNFWQTQAHTRVQKLRPCKKKSGFATGTTARLLHLNSTHNNPSSKEGSYYYNGQATSWSFLMGTWLMKISPPTQQLHQFGTTFAATFCVVLLLYSKRAFLKMLFYLFSHDPSTLFEAKCCQVSVLFLKVYTSTLLI